MIKTGSEGSGNLVPPAIESVAAWIDERLALIKAERTGELAMPHLTPWSVVFCAPTSIGLVWLKVPAQDNTFEAGIYRILLEEVADNVLTPIGSDPETGWLLLPDGGRPLAEVAKGSQLVRAMCIALPQYARLQRATAARVNELLWLGLGDLRPQFLADRFDGALAAMGQSPAPLIELAPKFTEWCDELKASPLAATIDHNDLHPWNVLGLSPDTLEGETAVFYDWGDSVVAHPFGSTLEPISRVRRLAGLDRDDADVLRMRDSYLEAFDDILSRRESAALIDIAWRVAKAARPVVWGRTPDEIRRYIDNVSRGELAL